MNHSSSPDLSQDLSPSTDSTSLSRHKRVHNRGTTKKAAATRARILSSALELFREKGYDETSMRDIAAHAETAVGSAYYYYRTKQDLVLAFYEDQSACDGQVIEALTQETTHFRTRFVKFIEHKFAQLSGNRRFINVLANFAAAPEGPHSPFSQETKHIRDDAINNMEKLIEGSDVKISPILKGSLQYVLWFYMMGMIFFWIHDKSSGQSRSHLLLGKSIDLCLSLFRLSTLPLTKGINNAVASIVDLLLENKTTTPHHTDVPH